jgi:hypothetical protein
MVVSVIFEVLESEHPDSELPEDKDADKALRDVEKAVRQDRYWAEQIEKIPSSVMVLPLATAGYVRSPEGAVHDDEPKFDISQILNLPGESTKTQQGFFYRPVSVPERDGRGEYIGGDVDYEHKAKPPAQRYIPTRDDAVLQSLQSQKKKTGIIFKKYFGEPEKYF